MRSASKPPVSEAQMTRSCRYAAFDLWPGCAINNGPIKGRGFWVSKHQQLPAVKKPHENLASPHATPTETELASSYCPRCSAKLQSRSCKMICASCGYYMSCSDFY